MNNQVVITTLGKINQLWSIELRLRLVRVLLHMVLLMTKSRKSYAYWLCCGFLLRLQKWYIWIGVIKRILTGRLQLNRYEFPNTSSVCKYIRKDAITRNSNQHAKGGAPLEFSSPCSILLWTRVNTQFLWSWSFEHHSLVTTEYRLKSMEYFNEIYLHGVHCTW